MAQFLWDVMLIGVLGLALMVIIGLSWLGAGAAEVGRIIEEERREQARAK